MRTMCFCSKIIPVLVTTFQDENMAFVFADRPKRMAVNSGGLTIAVKTYRLWPLGFSTSMFHEFALVSCGNP